MPKQRKPRRPATTPEGRENQLVSLAIDLVEKQIIDGSVSSQVLSHYVKMGSTRERMERERLLNENELLKSKVKSLESGQRIEEMYSEALKAMRSYQGQMPEETPDEDVY